MEIHIGNRVAEVELVSKEDNKVVLTIDGKTFEADVVMAENGTCNILMDGRDIGTVVLPNATVKIFLTASPEARATRRWKEYQQKGIDTPYEDVLADVKQRDYQDTHRAAAPLKQAGDAVLLDTSELNFEQSFEAMKKMITEKVR